MATGDQIITNFPRESTMKEISQAVQAIALAQAGGKLETITTWDQIAALSRNGLLQKLYDYGDQLADKWTDTAGNKEYVFPWHFSNFDTEELEDGEQIQ